MGTDVGKCSPIEHLLASVFLLLMENIKVEYIDISRLKSPEYNPRRWNDDQVRHLAQSIDSFGAIDPLIVNSAPERYGYVIGGNFRLFTLKKLGYKQIPVVFVNIPDIKREKELNLRLNANTGEWDWKLLADFDESFLGTIGFSSEELDNIFQVDETPETFDLEKELRKLDIQKIEIKKGDVFRLGSSRLCCGDSTIEADILKLMNGEKADMCFTDPPYILDYLHGKKKHGNAVPWLPKWS